MCECPEKKQKTQAESPVPCPQSSSNSALVCNTSCKEPYTIQVMKPCHTSRNCITVGNKQRSRAPRSLAFLGQKCHFLRQTENQKRRGDRQCSCLVGGSALVTSSLDCKGCDTDERSVITPAIMANTTPTRPGCVWKDKVGAKRDFGSAQAQEQCATHASTKSHTNNILRC